MFAGKYGGVFSRHDAERAGAFAELSQAMNAVRNRCVAVAFGAGIDQHSARLLGSARAERGDRITQRILIFQKDQLVFRNLAFPVHGITLFRELALLFAQAFDMLTEFL